MPNAAPSLMSVSAGVNTYEYEHEVAACVGEGEREKSTREENEFGG